MWDADIEVFVTKRDKTEFFIEAQCVRLRAEFDFGIATFTRHRQQGPHDRRTNALPACPLHDGHAADLAIGQQTTSAYSPAIGITRQYMRAIYVKVVPFQIRWNALLHNENRRAHLSQCRCVFGPFRRRNGKCRGMNHACEL